MTALKKYFCDTSFLFALLFEEDDFHQSATELYLKSQAEQASLVTTWDVVSETITLFRYKSGFEKAKYFIERLVPFLELQSYEAQMSQEAIRLYVSTFKSYRLSFCDVTSYVVVTDLLGGVSCFSFDKDFINMGLDVVKV